MGGVRPELDSRERVVRLFKATKQWLAAQLPVIALILLLLVFHAANNLWVVRNDNVYFTSDPANFYWNAASLAREWAESSFGGKAKFLVWEFGSAYPVMFPGVSSIVLSVFGFSQDKAVMSSLLWLAILLFSTYALAAQLFDRKVAAYSVVLLSFFPGIAAATRGFSRDLALASMVALSAALLLSTQGMKRGKQSLLFGLAIGLTALTYASFSLFLIGPFIFAVVVPVFKSLRDAGLSAVRIPLRNLLLALAVALLLASPWYIIHAPGYLAQQRLYLGHFGSPELSVAWALGKILSPFPVALVAVAMLAVLWAPGKRGFLLGWTLLPFAFHIFLPLQGGYHIVRYILPAVPGVAIVLGFFLERAIHCSCRAAHLEDSRAFSISIALLLALGAAWTAHLTYFSEGSLVGPWGEPGGIEPLLLNMGGRLSPVRMEGDIGSTVDLLVNELSSHDGTAQLFVMNPFGFVSQMLLTELRTRQALKRTTWYLETSCLDVRVGTMNWVEDESCGARLASADYLIIEEQGAAFPQGDLVSTWPITSAYEYIEHGMGNFTVIAEIPNWDMDYYVHLPASDFLSGRALVLTQEVKP